MDPITKSAAPIWMYIQAPGDGLHSLLGACMVVDKYRPAAPFPGFVLEVQLLLTFGSVILIKASLGHTQRPFLHLNWGPFCSFSVSIHVP